MEAGYREARSSAALTYDHYGAIGAWAPGVLPPGPPLRQPALLFKRLDESVVEEEYARLEGQRPDWANREPLVHWIDSVSSLLPVQDVTETG